MAKDWKRLGLTVKRARDDRGMTQADAVPDQIAGEDANA